MSFLSQDDMEFDTKGTPSVSLSLTSRLYRGCSEPPRLNKIERPNPNPSTDLFTYKKCAWCNTDFRASDTESLTPSDALRSHICTFHPSIARFSRLPQKSPIHAGQEKSDDTQDGHEHHDYSSKPQQSSLNRELSETEDRLARSWNIHEVSRFTEDYHGEKETVISMWKETVGDVPRPTPYVCESVAPGEFIPLTKPDTYIDRLKNPEAHSTKKLYAITANAALALRIWQDEYLAIDKLTRLATRQVLKKTADPRKLERLQVFEDKKEAMLYGYKYNPKETSIGHQDPFLQGGFKPTPTQARKMKAKAADDDNVDGWTPIIIDGEEYIPGIRQPPRPAPRRKRDEALITATAKGKSEPEQESRPLRKTRYSANRHQTVRETSAAVTENSSSAPTTPHRKRSKAYASVSKPSFTNFPVETKPSVADHGSPSNKKPIAAPEAVPMTKSPISNASAAEKDSQIPYEDPLLNPKNQEKIRLSKNPKRTEAMIIHWAKFNSEGRTRNPKRSKAQIESSKVDTELKPEGGEKSGIRKRMSTDDIPTHSQKSTPAPPPKKARHNPNILPAEQPFIRLAPPPLLPSLPHHRTMLQTPLQASAQTMMGPQETATESPMSHSHPLNTPPYGTMSHTHPKHSPHNALGPAYSHTPELNHLLHRPHLKYRPY